MSTQKQIKANRKNAKKSTGPKTAEGKATSAKNAVKHGLFAAEAVVTGENPADYEAYLESFLAEMKPVGAVETMLAERFVSLSWRLLRAQRMQNQAVDRMIEQEVTSPLAQHIQTLYCQAEGIPADDKKYSKEHLPLGRIADKDFSYYRVLDRMLLYERRLENSMLRISRELKKLQIMRQIERRQISEGQAIEKAEAFRGKSINLKKQSQLQVSMDANPFIASDYNYIPPFGIDRHKSKQSQIDAPFGPEKIPATEKPSTSSTG